MHRVKVLFPQSSLLLRLALSVHRLLSLQARHLYRCTHTISGCLTAGTRPPDANTHPPSQTQPRAEPYRLLPAGTFAAPACLPEDSTCRAQKPCTNTPTTGKGCTKAALPAGPSAGHPRPPRGSRPLPLPLPLPAPCRAARRPPSPWPQPLPRPLSRGAGLTLLTPRPPFVERGKEGGRGLCGEGLRGDWWREERKSQWESGGGRGGVAAPRARPLLKGFAAPPRCWPQNRRWAAWGRSGPLRSLTQPHAEPGCPSWRPLGV